MTDQPQQDMPSKEKDIEEKLRKIEAAENEWTGSFFKRVYRDQVAAKKHARRAADIIILLAGINVYMAIFRSVGVDRITGLIIGAVFLLSAIGIYKFFLPAAYLGAAIYIILTLINYIFMFSSYGISGYFCVSFVPVAIFLGAFYRAVIAIRQYQAFLLSEEPEIGSDLQN